MGEKTEVTASEFASYLFSSMNREPSGDHWDSIRDKAKPHVDALLAMADGLGYSVTGILGSDGKKSLNRHECMKAAQLASWGTELNKLVVGDRFWYTYDTVEEDIPVTIESIDFKQNTFIFKTWDDQLTRGTFNNEIVIKAPNDYEDFDGGEDHRYQWVEGRKFWLAKAEELGIK